MRTQKNIGRNWLPNEDRAFIELHQQRGVRKWTQISQLLKEEFGFMGRSAKNCRERYNNHLNPQIKRDQWSSAEEDKLLQIQRQMGNCWADISRQLPGRTDNAVKNKFYSKFRKALRNIHEATLKSGLEKCHQLKMGFIHRLITQIDLQFKQKNGISPTLIQSASQLRDKILTYENIDIKKEAYNAEDLVSMSRKVQSINHSLAPLNTKENDSIVESSQPEQRLFSPNNKIYFQAIGQAENKMADQQWMKSTPHLIIISSEEKLFSEQGLNDGCLEWDQYGQDAWGTYMCAEASIDT